MKANIPDSNLGILLKRMAYGSRLLAMVMIVFFSFIFKGYADDEIIVKVTDPAPVCAPNTVDLTLPEVTEGSTVGLVYSYFSDFNMMVPVPDPHHVGAGVYYIRGTRMMPFVSAAISVNVVVTDSPVAQISYSPTSYCHNNTTQVIPMLTGSNDYENGIYSCASSNFSLNSLDGSFTPANVVPGAYRVVYTIAAAKGCGVVTAETDVTVTQVPSATIGNLGPYCTSIEGQVSLPLTGTAAYTGGTFTADGGLSIDSSTGAITPSSSVPGTYLVTYTIPASGGCAAVPVTANVIITAAPTATISYPGPFCNKGTSAQAVTLSGTGAYTGGSFSSTVGLQLDPASGEINPAASATGSYIVTYTIPASGGCSVSTTTTTVEITELPTATIDFGSPLCNNISGIVPVTLSGTADYHGGSYLSQSGLSINEITGDITPSTSTPGTYDVTYTIPSRGGCSEVVAHSSVTITEFPVFTIDYGDPFCVNNSNHQSVTISGSGAYQGGVFSSGSGLSLNSATGEIEPALSQPGTYEVIYTSMASGGCPSSSATTTVIITEVPTANIIYPLVLCQGASGSFLPFLIGTGAYTGGVYRSTTGLTINSSSGAITPSSSAVGDYTVEYTIPSSGGCDPVTASAKITISEIPSASISYSTPICNDQTAIESVIINGSGYYQGGSYSASSSGLSLDTSTGTISPSSSQPGSYIVTYTIPPIGGCPSTLVTTTVEITAVPNATISYEDSYCKNFSGDASVTMVETNSYTGGTFSSTNGLTLNSNSGAITPSMSTVGQYIVSYTISATGGCTERVVNTTVGIAAVPTATIHYNGPFCTNVIKAQPVDLQGTGNYMVGNFSASSLDLSIDANTGAIDASASKAGNYVVTYTLPAAGGCNEVIATTNVTIIEGAKATIQYTPNPICEDAGSVFVTISGTGAYSGGTFQSKTGLSINATTGEIDVSNSDPGSYVVTYTIPASAECLASEVTTTVTITAIPHANFTYVEPICINSGGGNEAILTGDGAYTGGVFSTSGGVIDPVTGKFTPVVAGAVDITYTIPASGGCEEIKITKRVFVHPAPTAALKYNTPFCNSIVDAQSSMIIGEGTYQGGIYSASPEGLSIDVNTGDIIPALSTPGSYVVTYTIPAVNGCSAVLITKNVEITQKPEASISYSGPYCNNDTELKSVSITGVGAFTGGIYKSTTGLSIDSSTGTINPSMSTPGTYEVIYSVPADGVCAAHDVTTSVTISKLPTAAINYFGPYCSDITAEQEVNLSGSSAYTGGVFTASPEGLNINSVTGAVIPSSSLGKTYHVTYTLTTTGGCGVVTAESDVTVFTAPSATIQYTGPFCLGDNTVHPVVITGSTIGSFSADAGLSLDVNNGAIIPGTSTPGSYMVTYEMPASGPCGPIQTTTPVQVGALPELSEDLIVHDVLCKGNNDGSIIVNMVGSDHFAYDWSGPENIVGSGSSLTGLASGLYSVKVTTDVGCSRTFDATVTEPDQALTLSITESPATKSGSLDGAIDVTVTGGVAPYSYSWNCSNNQVVTTEDISGVGCGVYNLTVTDNNGCQKSAVAKVLDPPTAVDEVISTNKNTSVLIDVAINDTDSDGTIDLSSIDLDPSSSGIQTTMVVDNKGSFSLSDNKVVFTPVHNFYGNVQIPYVVSDNDHLLSNSAVIEVDVIQVNMVPTATDDIFLGKENNPITGNLLDNDIDDDGDPIVLDSSPLVIPVHGSLVLNANGDFEYQPNIDFIGEDSFSYQVCDNGDPSLCSEASVILKVEKDEDCKVLVPNTFTPNADGVHDYFKVRCLYNYENAEMLIYNRNGSLVFSKKHYGNVDYWGGEDKAYWNGRSDNKMNVASDELPVGTYFYILKLGDGNVFKGYVFLGK